MWSRGNLLLERVVEDALRAAGALELRVEVAAVRHLVGGIAPWAGMKLDALEGSFSAVSTPIFASTYSCESSRQDLHNTHLCTVL